MHIQTADHTYFMGVISLGKRNRKGELQTVTTLIDVRDWEYMWQDIEIALNVKGAVSVRFGRVTIFR